MMKLRQLSSAQRAQSQDQASLWWNRPKPMIKSGLLGLGAKGKGKMGKGTLGDRMGSLDRDNERGDRERSRDRDWQGHDWGRWGRLPLPPPPPWEWWRKSQW